MIRSTFVLTATDINSCDGRVVKALDLKSNGVSPRRFESCSQRQYFATFLQPFLSQQQYSGYLDHLQYGCISVFILPIYPAINQMADFLTRLM